MDGVLSPAPKPRLTMHWVLEDVETEQPRITHYFHRSFGRALQWPALGDRVSPPDGVNAHAPDTSQGGKVTDVLWAADMNNVDVWIFAHAHDIDDEVIEQVQESGWDYGSTSETADD